MEENLTTPLTEQYILHREVLVEKTYIKVYVKTTGKVYYVRNIRHTIDIDTERSLFTIKSCEYSNNILDYFKIIQGKHTGRLLRKELCHIL